MQRKNFSSLLTLFVFTLLVFTGCNKDKDVKPSVKAQVTGFWKVESSRWVYSESGKVKYDETDNNSGNTIEFKNDGTVISKSDGDTETGVWSLMDQDKKISATIDGYTSILEIKELTANKLTLYSVDSGVDDGISYKEEATIVLTK